MYNQAMSILLVEDDKELAAGLIKALRNEGIAANHVETGKAALHVLKTEPPDIIILDLGLPDIDGIDLLGRLRAQQPELPVLLLTARASIDDKVAGLDRGADDYLSKPFEMAELMARLRALGRRVNVAASNVISVGNVRLDTSLHQVFLDDQPVELPRREYMLLRVLMENVGRVQTRDSLERNIYNWGEEVASNALEVHIHQLRKKLGARFIHTVRGVGYKVSEG
jgi:DNA-binding response OmpR family regulator